MNDVSVIYIGFAFILLIAVGALLGEVAVKLAKMFGFEYEQKPNVDFMDRLNKGEVITADNMFEIKND